MMTTDILKLMTLCLPSRFCLMLAVSIASVVAFTPSSFAASQSVPVDRVVAVVNNEVITAVELRDRIKQAVGQLQRQKVQLPPDDVLERQILERLIVERAQFQRAEEMGIRVDDAMLARAVERVAQNNNLTEVQLRAALAEDGITWKHFRAEIRSEMVLGQLREREVNNRIVVTDAEVDSFLANKTSGPLAGSEVLLAHILLRLPESPSREDLARQSERAADISRRLATGDDFARLAAANSDAPDAVSGGLIDWRPTNRLPALFVEAIRDLKPGQVSPVLRSPAGLHIVKLVEVRGAEAAQPEKLEQTRASHILIRSSEVLSDTEAQARLVALRERIMHGESFADMARAHSADLSAAKGGDLGWVYPGDTVPEFERAMNALQPGEVSQPVHSPFGWHLIQVLERRVQDVSGERKRNAARNVLRERKSEEAYEEWLRELRDSTYVEYRLDRD